MASQNPADYGITFSRGAQATPQGVANAAANGIVNNVQTSNGVAVQGSYSNGQNVSGQQSSSFSNPNELSQVMADVASFKDSMQKFSKMSEPPAVQPNPMQSPVVDQNLKSAFTTMNESGQPPPQEQGLAATAVSQATKQAAGAPKFYLPGNTPGYAPETVFNAQGQALTKEQYLAQSGKGDFSDVTKGGVPTPNATPIQGIEAQLAADPGYQQLLKDYAEFNNIQEQSKTLVETYDEVVKKSGLEAINMELVNMKSVIEGTEDDIRNEVKAASGFATDSQVMALAQARNKTLIKSYNKLVDQQAAIKDQVNTMINLASQDRQFAMQSITQKLQIDQQILDYRDKFVRNAREGYNNVINAIGYTGLYESLKSDPGSLALAERTLGMPSGTLAQGASQELQARLEKQKQIDFDNSMKTESLKLDKQRVGLEGARLNLARQEASKGSTSVVDTGNGKVLVTYDSNGNITNQQPISSGQTQSTPQQLSQTQSNITQISELTKLTDKSNAVGTNALSRLSLANVFTGTKSNFIADVEQIRKDLTLDKLQSAKANGATFGALSEGEMKLLDQSASKIGTWAVEKDGKVVGYKTTVNEFNKELEKINNFAKLDYVLKGGNPGDVGVQQMPDGTYWTQNSNGSMTQL